MTVLFSAIAKRKLELLSILLTIQQGEDTLCDFLETLESKITQVSNLLSHHPSFLFENLKICTVSDQSFFTYVIDVQTITIVDLFDHRQNPILIYKDLIEYFS